MNKEMLKDINQLDQWILFGSRSKPPYFNHISSDWDVCASFTDANVQKMLSAGFTVKTPVNEDYTDELTKAICTKVYGSNPSDKLHVVLRTEYDLFVDVWNSITPIFYYTYLSKASYLYTRHTKESKKKVIRDCMNQLYLTARSR
jgi:hypothetical protein